MKIAMIGSGAAGSVFAAYLRKGGAELWLVDKYKAVLLPLSMVRVVRMV